MVWRVPGATYSNGFLWGTSRKYHNNRFPKFCERFCCALLFPWEILSFHMITYWFTCILPYIYRSFHKPFSHDYGHIHYQVINPNHNFDWQIEIEHCDSGTKQKLIFLYSYKRIYYRRIDNCCEHILDLRLKQYWRACYFKCPAKGSMLQFLMKICSKFVSKDNITYLYN